MVSFVVGSSINLYYIRTYMCTSLFAHNIAMYIFILQWSYGITCWEIFSLGRLPYPGVDNANVITLLKSGKRLEKPELCPSKL